MRPKDNDKLAGVIPALLAIREEIWPRSAPLDPYKSGTIRGILNLMMSEQCDIHISIRKTSSPTGHIEVTREPDIMTSLREKLG